MTTEDWQLSITSDRDYDPAKFYLAATDGHGHSAKMQLKLREGEMAQIQQWVGRPETPYRTAQDVIRDAVHHRLVQLHQLHEGGKLSEGLTEALVVGSLSAKRVLRQTRREAMDILRSEVRELAGNQQYTDAAEALEDMEDALASWPPAQAEEAAREIEQLRGMVMAARSAQVRKGTGK